jgi:hypothetical protein
MHVCFFFSCIIFWAGGRPKCLPPALSSCCYHIYSPFILNLWYTKALSHYCMGLLKKNFFVPQ